MHACRLNFRDRVRYFGVEYRRVNTAAEAIDSRIRIILMNSTLAGFAASPGTILLGVSFLQAWGRQSRLAYTVCPNRLPSYQQATASYR